MTNYMTEEGELISRKTLPAELVAKLKQPLPPEAVKPHPTKPYLSTIKVPFVIERLNDVFGLGNWSHPVEVVEATEMVVVKMHLLVPEYGIDIEQFGGNDNPDRGDAYKGAVTDALSKCAAELYIGMDVYKGIRDNETPRPERTAKPAAQATSGSKTPANTLSFRLAEWREEEGKFGPVLILTHVGPKGGDAYVTERLFKNKNTAAYFEHLKDCTGKVLAFTTEKNGKYTNIKDLVSVDGVPYIKQNGTPPVAVQFSDGTQISDSDIPF